MHISRPFAALTQAAKAQRKKRKNTSRDDATLKPTAFRSSGFQDFDFVAPLRRRVRQGF
jgi:hypothetical protein